MFEIEFRNQNHFQKAMDRSPRFDFSPTTALAVENEGLYSRYKLELDGRVVGYATIRPNEREE
jgi:hypothetical protein